MNDPQARNALKSKVHGLLLEGLDLIEARKLPREQLRRECVQRVDMLISEQQTPLTGEEARQLVIEVMDEVFALGPIEGLMRDPTVSDILVNGPKSVFVERVGLLTRTDVEFRDDAHLMQVIQRIAGQMGRRIDESSPMLDARLECGSRVNAIIPPLALDGPIMSIRRFAVKEIEATKLVELGSISPEMCSFLEAAVHCKTNIVISGGTGTGKTTLLNVLSKWIPDGERVITLEDAAELKLQGSHVVSLETRPANVEGLGEVTQRDLLKNTLRMRPDRIIIGECRGAEALDMLQAMNTGHEGSMTTVHANTTRDAMRRLENMVAIAGLNFPVHVIRDQMASTLDLVVQISRVTGGRRKVVSVTEVSGMEKDVILLQDIFRYRQVGLDEQGHASGVFESCGVRPKIMERMRAEGIELPAEMFQRRMVG